MKLAFEKYSGNGNDFIIIDHPQVPVTKDLVKRLCHRHFGVGADGVLVLTSATGMDGEMRIFNADGGEASMCGNGLRCLATYIDDKKEKKLVYTIKTQKNVYQVHKNQDQIEIEMSEIKRELKNISEFVEFQKKIFIYTGVPHLVFEGQNIKELNLKEVAPKYRYHHIFEEGTNVNWVEVTGKNSAYVRTYERGVEDETLSCGTGLTAVALALQEWFGWSGEIELATQGGKHVVRVGEKIFLSGEVTRCFKGEVEV